MYCHKCGAKTQEGARFCSTCGSELLIPTKEEVVEQHEQANEDFKQGLRSLIISVCTCALSLFLGLLLLPLSIWGIYLGIKSKSSVIGKVGLIINILNIFIQVFSSIVFLPLLFRTFSNLTDSNRYTYKYVCTDYTETEITDNIIFDIRRDKTFELSYEYPDGSGLIKGNYRVNEYKKINDTYEYVFIFNADSRVIDNEEIEGNYQTKYKLSMNSNEITFENEISHNKYTCKRAN